MMIETKGKIMKQKTQLKMNNYVFLLPAAIIYLSTIVGPLFYSYYISFFKWNGISAKKFIGFQNYIQLFSADHIFKTALINNSIWIVLTLVITTIVALGLALILNKSFPGRTIFRGLFYFPCVIALIAVSIIWRWMYNPTIGFFNAFFKLIGSSYSQDWISNPETSLYAVFVASVWNGVGQTMILFLAGLQTVSKDSLEAATIDGANALKKFIYVTIPYLRETFIIVFATLIISAMKVFDIIQGLTAGGPNNATQMLPTYMYYQTFQYNNVGKGTTISCIMVLFMLIVIVPYIGFTTKNK